jgi:hypothetical protein
MEGNTQKEGYAQGEETRVKLPEELEDASVRLPQVKMEPRSRAQIECQHAFFVPETMTCYDCESRVGDIIADLRAENERLADRLSTAGTRIMQLTRELAAANEELP